MSPKYFDGKDFYETDTKFAMISCFYYHQLYHNISMIIQKISYENHNTSSCKHISNKQFICPKQIYFKTNKAQFFLNSALFAYRLNHQILCLCLILYYFYDRCVAKLYAVHHYDTQYNSIIDIRSISCFSVYKYFLSAAIDQKNGNKQII